MSTEANKALVRRFYDEMLTRHRLDAAAELFTEDYVDHDPGNIAGEPAGAPGARQEVAVFTTAFPDFSVTVEDLLAEGDRVCARVIARGTHRGDLMGIPPTGKPVTITGTQVWRIKDGKLAEGWLEIDRLGMLQQLGVVPAPEQPVH